jgi:hypothetical protein
LIVNHKIVPNNKRTFVQTCLKQIWTEPEAEQICEVVYTDNPKVDKSSIQKIFADCFPNHLPVAVLLDIYHARSRIIKEMIKTHPDFRVAKQDLTTIFATLQIFGHFPSPSSLSKELENWCQKYSIVYASSALNFVEQIDFLATNYKRYIYSYICTFINIRSTKEKILKSHIANRDLKPLITENVVHQIQLLQDDIESLWSIANFIHLGPQGTSFNEGVHSFLSSIKPSKVSKTTMETLEIMVGIACFTYNRKYFYICTFTF